MDNNIVNAKIISPDSPYDYVSSIWQEELIKQKNHIIVLYAQDGYGKTSYMAYYSKKISTKAYCAWYLLDRRDNQLKQFMMYLLMALERATGRKFRKEKQENIQEDFLEVIYQISYELEKIDRKLWIFFDEIQNLVGEEVLHFLDKFIEYTKDKVCFFFAGTEDLPTFLIKYLNGEKENILLTEKELRMNQEQIQCVLEKKGILDTGELTVFINRKTQGIPLQVMKEVFQLKCKGGGILYY